MLQASVLNIWRQPEPDIEGRSRRAQENGQTNNVFAQNPGWLHMFTTLSSSCIIYSIEFLFICLSNV